MARKRSKAKRKNNNNSSTNVTTNKWVIYKELSPACVQYDGPIRHKDVAMGRDLKTVMLNDDGNITTDAGGLVAYVFSNNPNSPGGGFGALSGFSNFAAVYDEYRVLGFEVEYIPFDKYNRGVSVYTTPIVSVLDYDNSTALGSYSAADAYGSVGFHSLDNRFKRVIRMTGIENSSFINTSAPTATYWVKLYTSGATASTPYGKLFLRSLIQFRGKGV